MPGEPENANPTILSASQLPTRQAKQKKPARLGPESKFKGAVFVKPSPLAVQPWGGATARSEFTEEPIDEQEIYDLISTMADPEHPVSLGQLSVVNLPDIHITPSPSLGQPAPGTLVTVVVDITPTITHCSLATIIGLGVRARLEQILPPNYRVDVRIKEGSHSDADQVSKQLADKERVAAALENDILMRKLEDMFKGCA